MPSESIRGTTIHYEKAGSGPDLLFVHGMCGDARVWEDTVGRLAGAHTCVSYDRRGHSRSPRGDLPESDAVHADDAAALIERLDLEPVVVASSGGARIAVELLRRRPELVRGAVLSEPPMLHLAPEEGSAFRAELVPRIEDAVGRGGPEAAVDAFFSYVCPGLWRRVSEEVRGRYRANAPALFAELEAPPNRLGTDELARLATPALVLSGSDSHPVFRKVAAVLVRSLPDARWMELAGSGHVTYAEKPAEFAAAVAAFVGEVFAPMAPSRR
jgi:3-oxoadipate enol-lactonase